MAELQRHVSEALGDPDAVLNLDESGFPKKGTKSVEQSFEAAKGECGLDEYETRG